MSKKITIGKNSKLEDADLYLAMANRHGLIAGATGTGKTVTLQKLIQDFSQAGITVFTADVKGDLSAIAFPGTADNKKVNERIEELGVTDFTPKACPVVLWDIYGQNGHPLRTTLSEVGPLLLGRLLNLNDTQQSILNTVYKIADDEGLLILDVKDLESLLNWVKDNAKELEDEYGTLSSRSIGTIQRGLNNLSASGGEEFFAEPAFTINNLFQKSKTGEGLVHVLDATKLIHNPILYSTFLLWLLSEIFEELPELGDVDQPNIVFIFDEAHLLFDSAPKALLDKIEQLVRLIRSKGVGVFFVTQNPTDIPDDVLGQLGNRMQHALRAFTPKDQKAVKAAAQTFRQNPELNTQEAITNLGVGEALVSFLDEEGSPSIVQEVKIIPPSSRIGSIDSNERMMLMKQSPFYGQYENAIDRESAHELLTKKVKEQVNGNGEDKPETTKRPVGRPRQSVTETMAKSVARSVGSQIGRQIVRGILGSIFKR